MPDLDQIDFSIIAAFIIGCFFTVFVIGVVYIKMNAPQTDNNTVRVSTEITQEL